MEAVNACQHLKDVEILINEEIWQDEPAVEWALQEKLWELAAKEGVQNVKINHPNFMKKFYDEVGEDIEEEVWLSTAEFVQQGGNIGVVEESADPWEKHCTVSEEFEQKLKIHGIIGKSFKVHFKKLGEVEDIERVMEGLVKTLLEKTQVEDGDMVGLEFQHSSLDRGIHTNFQRKEEHTPKTIVNYVAQVLQSNEGINLDEGLECQVTRVKRRGGTGRKRQANTGNVEDFLKNYRSVINVPGHDNICLPRALVTAIASVDNDPQYPTILKGIRDRKTLQEKKARQLMHKAGLENHQGLWGPEQLQQFQDILPDYQIKVFTKANCSDIMFSGQPSTKNINLFLHEEHYMVITKIQAFLNTSYYCSSCNQIYDHEEDHFKCDQICIRCFGESQCKDDKHVECPDCFRWFNSAVCYAQHKSIQTQGTKKTTKKSICEKIKRCNICKVDYRTRRPHSCDTAFCSFCKIQATKKEAHQCFMSKYKPKDKEAKGYIFFDFETQQVKKVDENKFGSVYIHEPICVVADKVCSECWKERNMSIHCENCKPRRKIFMGPKLTDNFTNWLFSEENRDCIAMAHNNKAYDGQFILDSLHQNAVKCPEIIFKGLEIMKLSLNGVKLLDSLCFLPMPLSAIPAAFNLQEMKKGYFPHMFTSEDKMDYVGPYPDAYYYNPAMMKVKNKNKFYEWYFKNKDKIFNFKQELLDYCISDVDILKMGVMEFRETFIKQTGLDPYWNAITISDACMKVFRSQYLQDKSIALIPNGEYRVKDRYSAQSIKWLRWVIEEDNIDIRHALNGGEVKINAAGHNYKVDGLHEKTVYEFNGCGYHGCMKCFNPNILLPLTGKLVKQANQETLDRKKDIEAAGYKVVEMWECTLRRQLKQNSRMNEFFKNQNIMEPMKARDAYYGGRTNCAKLYHKVKGNEQIHYCDVCSLYPTNLKYGIFPTGHPQIITEKFKDLKTKPYQGLIKCKVLAPRKLYHPVLPYRAHGKLMFPLCKECTQLKQRGPCDHSQEERAFWGSWVILEVYKAVELGYQVLDIAEVWDYGDQVKQYNIGQDPESGLFTEYINEFLKIKQEASGWPKTCKTQEDRERYLKEYEDHEGIKLNPDNIERNPALRALSKLCLNSFYGKFGQRNNMPKTKYIKEPEELYEIIGDATKEISYIRAQNDMVNVTYKSTDGFEEGLPSINVVIAAYVTAQARLMLYSYMEKLQESVLYYDTDSIIYLRKPGQELIQTGNYLGDMTNELEEYGEGAYISEFVSGGPKNYSYIVNCPDGTNKTTVKIRGFTLDSVAGKRLNMQTLRKKVKAYVKYGFNEKTRVVTCKIVRNKDAKVFTEAKCKTYSIIVDKRWCGDNYMTYPYGY